MTKEIKVTTVYNGTTLPSVYATNQLKVGETGAIVIYRQDTTTTDDAGNSTVIEDTTGVAFRFADATTPLDDATTNKLMSNLGSILQSYVGKSTPAYPIITFSGVLSYDAYFDASLKHYSLKIRLGYAVIAQLWYLGETPTPQSTPSQIEWSFANSDTPAVLTNIINSVAAAAIQKELYGG